MRLEWKKGRRRIARQKHVEGTKILVFEINVMQVEKEEGEKEKEE